uniref:Uncharacterized protein n=1 Tax=Megaviridae environmental sample TaxID=1737588 RepID=A0A5J6VKT2_9VIRU|nr:MAG: hypothetical protein [Megaviridae environmental sample]
MLSFYNPDHYNKITTNKLLEIKEDYKNSSLEKNKIKLLETEYLNQVKYYSNINNSNISNPKFINKDLTSLEILREQNKLIKILLKYCLQSKHFELNLFNNILNILYKQSDLLRQRLNQKMLKVNKKTNSIHRSSYKFCNFKNLCNYNYFKNKACCYQDHYVHNMVMLDINILLDYIKKSDGDDLIKKNKDILRSINTLNYVINHMLKELDARCLYIPKNKWENEHIVHNNKN